MATFLCQPVPMALTPWWGILYSDIGGASTKHRRHRDMVCWLHVSTSTCTDSWFVMVTSVMDTGLTWVTLTLTLLSGFPPSHCVALGKELLCVSKQQEVTVLLRRKTPQLKGGAVFTNYLEFSSVGDYSIRTCFFLYSVSLLIKRK